MSQPENNAVCKFSLPNLDELMHEFEQTGVVMNSIKRYSTAPEHSFDTRSPGWLDNTVHRFLTASIPYHRAFEYGHIPRIPFFKIALCSITALSDSLMLLYQLRHKCQQRQLACATAKQSSVSPELNPHEIVTHKIGEPLWTFIEWHILNPKGKSEAVLTTMDILRDPGTLGRACTTLLRDHYPDFFTSSAKHIKFPCVWTDYEFLQHYFNGAFALLTEDQRDKLLNHIYIAVSKKDMSLEAPPYLRLQHLFHRYRDKKVLRYVIEQQAATR